MDVLTILLAAHQRGLWWYYAFMATQVGAVIGGYITDTLARKGGKGAFERKLSKRRANKVFKRFERWGFFAVAVPALLNHLSRLSLLYWRRAPCNIPARNSGRPDAGSRSSVHHRGRPRSDL